MNSFYKGGSELPTGKGSSCSNPIKSKKLGLQLPKLLTHFRFYFSGILPVLMKYLLSTDIVLITQSLRKHINKGKTCYQSTCQVLHIYLILVRRLVAKKLVRNFIKPKAFSSPFYLTNFTLSSAFLLPSWQFSSGCPLGFFGSNPKPRRNPLEENTSNGRSWSGIGRTMVDYRSTQETHKNDYRMSLASPLLSTCYAQGRYKKCTRHIQQKQAFQPKENSDLTQGVGLERSVLSGFKSICEAQSCRVNTLLGSMGLILQRALKCFLFVASHGQPYRMVMTCIFLMIVFQSSYFSFKALKSIRAIAVLGLMVSMFSLSAQTPRRDSGADGLSEIKALGIGDTIPERLWNLKMPVYNDSKGRSSISLNDYKDNKLIILDFWATWCSNCLEGFPKLDLLKDTFKEDFGVLLINCKKTGDNKETIDRVFKRYKDNYQFNVQFPYLIADTIFDVLFPHRGVPHVVWIGNDRVVKAITYTAELQADNVRQILSGQKASFYRKEDNKYKVEDSLSTDTLKLFSSYLSKRREGIREMGVEIKEKGNEKEFTFLNSSVAMRIYEYLRDSGHPIERNLWVFDNNVSKELRRKLKTPQRYVDEYCYFLRYPKDRNGFDPYRKMIHDIQDGFGIKWEVRKGILEVWKIESSPEAIRYKTRGKIPLVAIGINDNKKFIQNIPLCNSFNALSWFLNKPVVLGYIADIKIDFELPTDLLDYTDEQLRKLLEQLGAKITVGQQEVAYVYFSKDKGE